MGLEINHLIKRYGGKTVLHGISLEARTGQAFGLLGGNGAGKTTTIRSVLGLVEYESGSITWDGKPIKDNRPSIGYLPEERGLYPKEKVSEQLVYFAMLEGLSRPAAVKAMRGWLERLGIAEHEGKRVEQLSKGNQQKVQIISSLIHDPELVILDEPFSGLDPVNSDMLAAVVQDQLKLGKTMIFSSHQMGQVERFCDQVCILKRGEMTVSGKLADIKRSYGRTSLLLRSEQDLTPHLATFGVRPVEESLHEWQVKVDSEEQAHGLMQSMAGAGVKLLKFEIKEPTLHEIFIEKVGEGA
ncbi:ABC transporter ATP-binding protein [Paenibacillus pasadenensis]|uniref:ABC transporter, ATP-binding protein n=1 Tax=Paenibacillus pasadenensis TaxID=217090 RepID=A0A2N5N0H2_9BACL|nr:MULTISPECIES: ATP-binding cassette domain-containing protein [Paenibacillus]PLT43826.1 ABC transporter, ATP-binding protein [Paenibacillus pasadenensis]QGG54424.1 ATP-binding cassette domain-containing protein [Paenibacillus sp. B01]